MITKKELNPRGYKLTPEQEENLAKLHAAINKLRVIYGDPMLVTSGVRSVEDQRRIYVGKKNIPMGSAHLKGAACDVWDRDKKLSQFCLQNLSLLEELGLYIEDPLRTPSWVHFQILPPASGNRVFQP